MRRRIELVIALLLLSSCGEDPVPKPRGWPRIDLPPVSYTQYADEVIAAETPTYARMVPRRGDERMHWYDMRFAGQRATAHLTWSRIDGNLPQLIEDAHEFKRKHEAKAARIGNERMLRDSSRVFGSLFAVEGDVASPFVFYLTDSTDNFLYGALYFDARPNADSLAPVTARLRDDLRHFAATLEWRGNRE